MSKDPAARSTETMAETIPPKFGLALGNGNLEKTLNDLSFFNSWVPHCPWLGLAEMIFYAFLTTWTSEGLSQVAARPIPPRNELPVTPESFCKGMPTIVQASAKQNPGQALNSLCQGTTPTNLLRDLIANPYKGEPNYQFRSQGDGLIIEENIGNYVRFNVAFSIRIQGKSAVSLLLGEESMLRDPVYSKGDGDPTMYVQFQLMKPDLRQPLLGENDGDIAFRVSQRTVRTASRRPFNNLTEHDLKLYRMFDNNFDFMIAVRSLNREDSSQSETKGLFNKATVIRAAIADPKDKQSAILITLLNFEVFDQDGQDATVRSIFTNFINRDIKAIHSFHQKK